MIARAPRSPPSQAAIIKGTLSLHSSFQGLTNCSLSSGVCFMEVSFSERQLPWDAGHRRHRLTEPPVPQVQRQMERLQLFSTHQCSHSSSKSCWSLFRLTLYGSSFSSRIPRLWHLTQDGDFTLAMGSLLKASPLSGIQTSLARSSNSRDSGGAHQH